MLERVVISGVDLPRLYMASTTADVELAQRQGIPYIKWTRGNDALVKMLLRPTLEKLFPHINWSKVLGRKRSFATDIVIEHRTPPVDIGEEAECPAPTEAGEDLGALPCPDKEATSETASIADDTRIFSDCGGHAETWTEKLDIEDYIGDLSSSVNLEVLQRLKLMPAFIGDILDCVKTNIGNGVYWREGYNKKLKNCSGRYDVSKQLPNLVILDVSGSIPRGISATMISLIDTLRTQLSADLIITASRSRFYRMGDELPNQQAIRDYFDCGNETSDFLRILSTDVRGKHYGHVFSFGDNDTPCYEMNGGSALDLANTKVDAVHHYHTGKYGVSDMPTGYGKWADRLGARSEIDTSWCNVIY